MRIKNGFNPTGETSLEKFQHLLILCCYGGVPFIDYLTNNEKNNLKSTHLMDPFDWIAIDSEGNRCFNNMKKI